MSILILCIYFCLRYATECTQGVKNGILFCIEVPVPSLFLFMALSSYAVKSGIILKAAEPFEKLSVFLFRLPYGSFAAIILSVIGGYPVGAKAAAMLYDSGRLSESEAQKTAYIAVCAGPGFLMNYVGRALLGSQRAGAVLLAAQITGMLCAGFLVGRRIKTKPIKHHRQGRVTEYGNLLIQAVSDASHAIFRLCGMIVICSALIEVIAAVSPNDVFTDIASAAVEITTGCDRMCGSYPPALIAFFIGFGGISVHLQIYAGMGGLDLNKGLFFLCRIIQGIITAVAAYILFMIFPIEQSVFNSTDAPLTVAKSATLAGSAALVLSSLCFAGSIHKSVNDRLSGGASPSPTK
ncbi:MAG: hypothetical protein IJG87_00745 [Ruminococcus sp.]|nr:hypothetical protein [Ruminococcus sp.]